jgi:hypothetical protein
LRCRNMQLNLLPIHSDVTQEQTQAATLTAITRDLLGGIRGCSRTTWSTIYGMATSARVFESWRADRGLR